MRVNVLIWPLVIGCSIMALGLTEACKGDQSSGYPEGAPSTTARQGTIETGDMTAEQWLDRIAQQDVMIVALAKLGVERATDARLGVFASTVLMEHARLAVDIRMLSDRTRVDLEDRISMALREVSEGWSEQSASVGTPAESVAAAESHEGHEAERVFEREFPGGAHEPESFEESQAPAEVGAPPQGEASVRPADPLVGLPIEALTKRLDTQHRSAVDALQRADRGAAFDKVFVTTMVGQHEATVKLFEATAAGVKNAQIERFAVESLPMARRHLAMARALPVGD